MDNIDSARQYLRDVCAQHFRDKTFEHYIDSGIAGDYAYEIATYIESLRQQLAEQTSGNLPVPYHTVVHALASMSMQYLVRPDGTVDHQFMSAGEAATEVLERLGLLTGEFGVINDEAWEESWVEQYIATYSKPITAEDKV